MANTIRLKRGTVEPTAGSLVTGEVAINTTNGNAYTLTDAGDVVQIGASAVSLTATVRNETGATLTKGQVVYLNGASGNKPLAVLAQANSEANSSGTYGLVQADIANNNNGTIVIAGFINKLNTQGYTDGDKVYLSPTTAGGWTTTKPSAPNHIVFLGTITYAHQTQGAIQLRIANGFEIEELHNVSISGLADKDIISYDSASGLYKNQTATALGLAPIASPTFTGNVTAGTNLISANSSGDEGGEILLAKPQTNTTLSGTGVTIDVYQNKLRIFEQGGSARGAYIDLTAAGAGVATNLLSGGATSASWGSITGTLSSQTDLNNALAAKAPLASPTFTGTPAAPTATAGTNTTQVATTAFVTTAVSTKANIASPTFTGTPAAPTPATATNSTQIATTAYVKTNLASYATLAGNPAFTGSPTATTQAYNTSGGQLATTSYVYRAGQRPRTELYGSQTSYGALDEKVHYSTNGNNAHNIDLYYAGYLNNSGAILMFVQNDNAQMAFSNSGVTAPNGDRYYAAFVGAVVFAVKSNSLSWNIYGDLTNTQYPIYGTVVSGPGVNTNATVNSGYMDYNNNTVYAYTYEQEIATGWGGTTVVAINAPYGTTMSGSFQYTSTDYYYLTADGSGGYSLTFDYSTGGGGYDAYGTKYGTPYWDSGYNALYQSIADGNGGTTSIAWDGYSPYPTNGTQVSTTSYGNSGYLTDAAGQSFYVIYDETYYADGNGGSYASRYPSSGYYWPSGWATEGPHFDTTGTNLNTNVYYYDAYSSTIYPWSYGYVGEDGMGMTTWFTYSGSSYPANGTRASNDFQDSNYNYVYIAADGNGGFYLQST